MIEAGKVLRQSIHKSSVCDAIGNARMPKKQLIGIVDDDSDLPIALSSLVRSLGYAAECFASVSQLLDRGELQDFSCILSDIHMPVMNGLDLTVRLRQVKADLPVVLMTGRLEPGLEEKAYASGAVAFVTKPFDLEMLSVALAKAFSRKA